ncbi:MAG: BGTF surface domain-containing protein, partial [Halobacteriota archaeon]
IYREHDQDIAGTNTYGDHLQTITVENTGSLDPTYIDQITLQTDGTEVAAASSPTANETWVLQPTGAEATIDPSGTTVTLQTTLSEDAPGGETVSLRVPEPVDADGDGAYDPGDAGLFFEQDAPTGGFGPGPTLTVESESDSSSEPTTTGPSPIALSVTPPASNLSANATALPVEVSGNATDRSVQATLQYAANNSTVASQTGSLDRNGETEFNFDPTPGRYRVRVEALESDGVARSAVIVVEEPPSATLEALDHAITRGERVPVNLTLERSDTATISLRGPDGDRLERATVTMSNTTAKFAVDSDGTGAENRTAAVALESTDTSRAGLTWLTTVADNETATNRSTTGESGPGNASGSPPAHAASEAGKGTQKEPLEAGNYTISVATGGTVQDRDTIQVGANWTAAIEPMVAPRGARITSAEDVAKNASRRAKIASGDRLVIAVETAGLGSYARNITPGRAVGHANQNQSPGRSGGPTGRNKNTTTKANGTPPAFVSVGPKSPGARSEEPMTGLRRVEAPNSDRFFVVADPNASGRVNPGKALETAVVLTENTPFVPDRTNKTEQERRRAAVEVVEARAELAQATANDTLDLPTNATVPINGSTTVAPGTTATVHIEGTERNFSIETETTVRENGTYETTANLSEYDSGTNYTVTVTANDEQISEAHTGQFTGTESTSFAATGGGGGGGGGSAEESRPRSTPAETTTPSTDPVTSPLSDLPGEPVDRVVEAVPEPLRIGQSGLLILAFGTLALLTIGVGLKRLIRP